MTANALQSITVPYQNMTKKSRKLNEQNQLAVRTKPAAQKEIQITIKITAAQHEALRKLAAENQRNVSDVVRFLLFTPRATQPLTVDGAREALAQEAK